MLENSGEIIPTNPVDYVEQTSERLKTAYKIVRESLDSVFERAKQRYDARVKRLQFRVGDFVWYFCPQRRPRLGPKWQLLTTGPWEIIKVINAVNYVIKEVAGRRRSLVANIDRLRKYDGEFSPLGMIRPRSVSVDPVSVPVGPFSTNQDTATGPLSVPFSGMV